jgi:multidrug efflux pump subunit AcrA (membrane-fusion protein)
MSDTGLLKIQRDPSQAPRRSRRWRWGVAVAIGVAIAAALLRPRVPEVQLVSLTRSSPSLQYQQLTASGFVVAQRRAAVASKASGRLLELRVREGSRVKAGDLLARLDASDVQAQAAVAQAAVGQALAVLAQGQALLRQSQVELANAEAEFARTQQLRAQGFVSAQSQDAAQRRLDAARAAVASAQAGTAQASSGVTQARAQLAVQQVNQGFTEIRAPFDGVVLAKNANVGDLITPFSNAAGSQGAVLTLADLSTLEVEADVSEGSLAKVQLDQPVEIQLDALPGQRFRGQVVSIVPTVDRAKATVMTKLRFEQLDARVLPEMSAKAVFLSQRASDAEMQPVLAAPPKALDAEGAVWKLVKAADGTHSVKRVAVKKGRSIGELVELQGEGLSSGDRLVAAPQGLRDGQKVTVAEK